MNPRVTKALVPCPIMGIDELHPCHGTGAAIVTNGS